MKTKKVTAGSKILGRDFHIDLFEPEKRPTFMVIMFGGSGVDEEKYKRRSQNVIDVFDPQLAELEREFPFVFMYITAPYDVPFKDFIHQEGEAERWKAHVLSDILPLLPDLPFYFVGYSGGFTLAVHSLHNHERCFGGGALGGDQIPVTLKEGSGWLEALALYYNTEDRVYFPNQKSITELEEAGIVRSFRRLSGGHELSSYLQNNSFSGLIRRAAKLWNTGSFG